MLCETTSRQEPKLAKAVALGTSQQDSLVAGKWTKAKAEAHLLRILPAFLVMIDFQKSHGSHRNTSNSKGQLKVQLKLWKALGQPRPRLPGREVRQLKGRPHMLNSHQDSSTACFFVFFEQIHEQAVFGL